MQKIGVFLSSRLEVSPAYVSAAAEVGRWIGSTGRTLVYGGADRGLMEVLARAVKDSGGRVYGVMPQVLLDRGLESGQVDVAFHCADLHDRKATLLRESDVLVALPGGIGTLDEIFTALGANVVGPGRKPVVLYNVDGCWDLLLRQLDELHRAGLASAPALSTVSVATTVDELAALLG